MGQSHSYSPTTPWEDIRYVKVETTDSPSWVSWREVEVIQRTSPPLSSGDTAHGPDFPRTFVLRQNYPNPFNPSTTISFDMPENNGGKQQVNLTIYDMRGRRVRTLIDSELEPGSYTVHWDGRNNRWEAISSGLYLYTLRVGKNACSRKMMVLK